MGPSAKIQGRGGAVGGQFWLGAVWAGYWPSERQTVALAQAVILSWSLGNSVKAGGSEVPAGVSSPQTVALREGVSMREEEAGRQEKVSKGCGQRVDQLARETRKRELGKDCWAWPRGKRR